jgi:hypothetical protein
MAPTYRIERDRGSKEFPQQLAVLRERWPIAFPTKHEDVRPLAMGVAREVAAAMSWSLPYTLGVLGDTQSQRMNVLSLDRECERPLLPKRGELLAVFLGAAIAFGVMPPFRHPRSP